MSTHRIDAAAVRARYAEGVSIEELRAEFNESDDVRLHAILGSVAFNQRGWERSTVRKQPMMIPDVEVPGLASIIASKPDASPAELMQIVYEIGLRHAKPSEGLYPPIRLGRAWPECDPTDSWTKGALAYVLGREGIPLHLVGLGEEPARKKTVRGGGLHEAYRARIVALWNEGLGLREIAARLDVDIATVFKATRGLPSHMKKRRFHVVRESLSAASSLDEEIERNSGPPPKWRETIRVLYALGFSLKDVSLTCGLSESTVKRHVRDLAGTRVRGRRPRLSP